MQKIQVQFGGKYEPKDEKLIGLLKDAYKGKLLVCTALIKAEKIKPYSNYIPKISAEFRDHFEVQERVETQPPLYVYQEGEHFIMSDDYNAYYIYREKKYKEIMCVVLGEPNGLSVIKKSSLF